MQKTNFTKSDKKDNLKKFLDKPIIESTECS